MRLLGKSKRFATLLFLLIFSQTNLRSQTDSLFEKLRETVENSGIKIPENGQVAIGVISADKVKTCGIGRQNGQLVEMKNDTVLFEIGSITKVFTTLLFAKAVEEKKVGARDALNDFLPESGRLETKEKPIVLHDLATHSSGLPRDPHPKKSGYRPAKNNPYSGYSEAHLFRYLSQLKLKNAPGKRLEYSNTGMALLAFALEKTYGTGYENLVKQQICAPLGMKNTTISLSEAQHKNLLGGISKKGKPVEHWTFGAFGGAGALVSNVEDMLLFLRYNLAQPDTYFHQTFYEKKGTKMGLGWFVRNFDGNTVFTAQGATGGFRSVILFDKKRGIGVVVLSNFVAKKPQERILGKAAFGWM